MKLPSKVKVGAYTYPVVTQEGLRNGDQAIWGHFTFKDGYIAIETSINSEQTRQMVLLHEVLHALVNNLEFDWTQEEEEDFVKRFTHGLLAFIKENPKVVDYLKS